MSSRGNDVERLALARDAAHRREAPAHPRRLDRLAHDVDEAGRLEGVVRAEAARHLEDLLHRCPGRRASCRSRPGRAPAASRSLGEVDADDPLGALQPAARDRAEADHAGAEHDARRAAPRPSRCTSRRRGRSRVRTRTGRRGRAAPPVETFASAISGMTVYSANVDVPMKWRIGSPSRDSRVVPSGR